MGDLAARSVANRSANDWKHAKDYRLSESPKNAKGQHSLRSDNQHESRGFCPNRDLFYISGALPDRSVRAALVQSLPRQPSQLYEAVLEGPVLFALLWCLFRFTGARHRPGLLCGAFVLGYGVFRFLVEFVREPDQQPAEAAYADDLIQSDDVVM